MFGKKGRKLGVVIIHNLSAAWQGVSLYVCSRADISEKTERSCLKKVLVRSIIQQRLTSSTIHIHPWHIWKTLNKLYRQLPSNCSDVLQGFLRQKIVPPDILNLRWTGWFLVILIMVIPGSIKRAGQCQSRQRAGYFFAQKSAAGGRTKTTFLNPTNSNWTLSKLSDRGDAWI